MLNELHCAWLMGRAKGGEAAVAKYKGGNGETGAQDISIDDVIKWGTCGGAKILGLQNVGSIEPGMAADLSIYSLDEPRHFGLHDISIAPIASGGANVRMLIVNGRILVRNGQLVDFDLMELKADTMQAVNEIKEEKYKY
jgi:Cytosine deaminase and related metal-dependent hydrolases